MYEAMVLIMSGRTKAVAGGGGGVLCMHGF